jgi:hypothetical protein
MILAPVVASCIIRASGNDVALAFNQPHSYCVRQAAWNNAPTRLFGRRAYAFAPVIGTMWPFTPGERWLVGWPPKVLTRVCWTTESFATDPNIRIDVYDDWGFDMGKAICAEFSHLHAKHLAGIGPVYAGATP